MSEPIDPDFGPKPRKPSGGYKFHKPECICIACRAARKRAEKALAGTDGIPPTKAEIATATGISPRTTGLLAGSAPVPYSTANKPNKSALDADVPFRMNARGHRDRIAQWIALKTANPGMTNVAIAKALGLAPNTLNTLISRARREGWLTFDNPLDRIEHEIIPKAIENFIGFLDARDKDVTIEAVKGFSVPAWKEAKGIVENKVMVLALKIEMPEGDPSQIQRGVISGAPRLSLPAPINAEFTVDPPND